MVSSILYSSSPFTVERCFHIRKLSRKTMHHTKKAFEIKTKKLMILVNIICLLLILCTSLLISNSSTLLFNKNYYPHISSTSTHTSPPPLPTPTYLHVLTTNGLLLPGIIYVHVYGFVKKRPSVYLQSNIYICLYISGT